VEKGPIQISRAIRVIRAIRVFSNYFSFSRYAKTLLLLDLDQVKMYFLTDPDLVPGKNMESGLDPILFKI
jgi:hypothetical protein